MDNNETNNEVTENQQPKPKRKSSIILVIGIIIFGLLMFLGGIFVSKILDNNNKENNGALLKEDNNETEKNNNTESNIDINEDEVKKMSSIYINGLNPMKNECIKKSINNNCLSDEEITNLVFLVLDEEKKFDNIKYISEAETIDYVSYDVFQEYVRRMFNIYDYKIPEKFNMKYQYCHKYTNTGKNIERYTNGPECSFGPDAYIKIDDWHYNYESYKVEGDIVIVTAVALYQYNENKYENKTTNYIDANKTTTVDDYFDSRLTRLNYIFKYNDGNLTLISIKIQ